MFDGAARRVVTPAQEDRDALESLDDGAADVMLARCRDAADTGDAVVVATGSATLAARHATTVALFVAGRLLSWVAPAAELVPARQLLAAGSVSELVSCGSAARGSAAHPPGR